MHGRGPLGRLPGSLAREERREHARSRLVRASSGSLARQNVEKIGVFYIPVRDNVEKMGLRVMLACLPG